MCETLAGLRAAMAQYAGDFDPAVACPGRAGQVVVHAAAIEKMAATIKSLAATWDAQVNKGVPRVPARLPMGWLGVPVAPWGPPVRP